MVTEPISGIILDNQINGIIIMNLSCFRNYQIRSMEFHFILILCPSPCFILPIEAAVILIRLNPEGFNPAAGISQFSYVLWVVGGGRQMEWWGPGIRDNREWIPHPT